MPDVAVGLYDWAVVVDHEERRSWMIGHGKDPRTFAEWDRRIEQLAAPAPRVRAPLEVLSEVHSNLDRPAYGAAFDRIKQHISAGDCYQVNLTQRFSARVRGSSWSAYERLRAGSPAPYSAYLNMPDGQIMSSSPERFLRVANGRAITQPIKGTRPRRSNAAEDAALAEELRHSGKDRAENVMIVDLLRNDLGKSCVPGSVRATKMFDVESFANVHHLVSTVEGEPGSGRHALDLLRDCFPGGSITGAPKVRAMQIIEECEPQRRGVYCGAIGYVGFDGRMDTNIAIRTLVRSNDQLYAWAGGGIVADSDVDSEYQECLDKASGLLAVLASDGLSAAI
jgi:para-aminobenzoate synthetase component 1